MQERIDKAVALWRVAIRMSREAGIVVVNVDRNLPLTLDSSGKPDMIEMPVSEYQRFDIFDAVSHGFQGLTQSKQHARQTSINQCDAVIVFNEIAVHVGTGQHMDAVGNVFTKHDILLRSSSSQPARTTSTLSNRKNCVNTVCTLNTRGCCWPDIEPWACYSRCCRGCSTIPQSFRGRTPSVSGSGVMQSVVN